MSTKIANMKSKICLGSVQYMYCIENLTAAAWLFYVFPYIFKKIKNIRKTAQAERQKAVVLIYYLKAFRGGLFLSRLTLAILNINAILKLLDFSLVEVRDENGDLIWWQALYDDSMVIQEDFMARPEFQNVINQHTGENRIPQFLMRNIITANSRDPNALILLKILLLIRVIGSSYYSNKECLDSTFFFFSQKPWLDEVAKFFAKQNVKIISVGRNSFNIKELVLKCDAIKYCIKQCLYYWMTIKYWVRQILFFKISGAMSDAVQDIQRISNSPKATFPKIAVEYYGYLNLFSRDLNSDLFFCPQSNIPPEDVLIYFHHPVFPVTDEKWREIKNYGMSAVAINPSATKTPHVPVFKWQPRNHDQEIRMPPSQDMGRGRNSVLIQENLHRILKDYYKKYDFWVDFITQHNIKLHVSWYKHDAKEYAMWDALQNTGGAGVIYQRSFESAPNPWTISAPDVFFGFSKLAAHLGKDKYSTIPYFVVTGYLGDYRFPFVQKKASNVRSLLLSHGARKILTYFDENSVDDQRWNIGHYATQENYTYLLNKVLEVPWLGLILKPKIISDLRRRLGSVVGLLDRAVQTGRCFIFKDENIIGLHPPATAALAADIAVHGHFFAATAGVESALAGTKTLMLDREGYSTSPLYKLGVGRVIFKNWDELWKACEDYWNSSEAIDGFGDWSSVLDEIDPFRDGRAAQRMGTYLKWLMEGFKANLPRETVLADAAERYAKMWGKDKILSVNCAPKMQECFSVR